MKKNDTFSPQAANRIGLITIYLIGLTVLLLQLRSVL